MALRLIALACLVLATLSGPVSAQTEQDEKLKQVISSLRACVRANAPDAEAAGIPKSGELIEFFQKRCFPPLFLVLGQNKDAGQNAIPGQITERDMESVGAVPPGIFRRAVGEEWTAVIEDARSR